MQGQSDTLTYYETKQQLISLSFKRDTRPINSASRDYRPQRSFECLGRSIHMVLSQYSGQYILHIQRVQLTHTDGFC